MTGKICGTGRCVPELVWDNEQLTKLVDTSDEWIRERTGIAQRHIAGEQDTTAGLAAAASREALKDAGVSPEEIDLILVATISSRRIMPGAACEVQKLIGADNATCFDLNGACTGFLFALNTAQAYISQGIYKTALVIGAECLSWLTNWKDRSTCILFGDGAGAAVVKAAPGGRYGQVTHSIGKGGDVLTCTSRNHPGYEKDSQNPETYMQMDGGEVFKFALSKVPKAIRELLEKEGLTVADVDYFLLHQANARIVQGVAKRLGCGAEKFPMNIQDYGNTSSASIPILMDELNKKHLFKPGDKLVLAGFGAGLSYGASLIEW